MRLWLLFGLLLVPSHAVLTSNGTSNGVGEEEQLKEKLEKVLPKFRPPLDMLNNTVFLHMDLFQILDVDEKNGVIMAKFWAYIYYFSENAKWNPADYEGIEILIFPAYTFWAPDIGELWQNKSLEHFVYYALQLTLFEREEKLSQILLFFSKY